MTERRQQRFDEVLQKRQPTLTVVFENVHDAHNISAVIRSCDAVGVMQAHGIYYGRTVFPPLGEKSSASARKWVDVQLHQTVDECYGHLRSRGFAIYTTHMSNTAKSLYDLDLTQNIALVFGNEHDGVSEEACSKADGNFLIPQMGMTQSLNISVACAVSLFEAFRQRNAVGMYNKPALSESELAALRTDWFENK